MKIVNYEEVSEIIKQNEELRKYSERLTQTNLELQGKLKKAEDKLEHLEQIAKLSTSPVAVASNEEELCKLEISRLYQAARVSPLEFNQVKSFEIYVKSLMLIRGKNPEDEKTKKSSKVNLDNDQLLQLAMQVVDDTNEQ